MSQPKLTPSHNPFPRACAIHISQAPQFAQPLYIGRHMADNTGKYRALLGLSDKPFIPASPWANYFTIEKDTWENRIQAIRMFRSRVWETSIKGRLHELRGRALVCWCAPRPCHGDILADLANKILVHGSPCPNPKCSKTLISELRPSLKDQDQIVEVWRCQWCRACGIEDRGPCLIHPPHDPETLL